MKDELQSKLVEILSAIQSTAGSAKDFAMEQLPDIAQSYLLYGRAIATFVTVCAILILAAGVYASWKLAQKNRQGQQDYEAAKKIYDAENAAWYKNPGSASKMPSHVSRSDYFESTYSMPFQSIPYIVGVTLLFGGMPNLFLVWLSPKVWLLKELAALIK